jgi:Holliday junction resolvase-like predicted endonuclease
MNCPVKNKIKHNYNWKIFNMINLEKIRKRLLKGEEIEDILKDFAWKDFEDIVAEIFSLNDFKTKRRVRFRMNKRYEIDIIAEKSNFVFCIDCKKWKRGRYKNTALKKAAEKQKERCEKLKKFLDDKRKFIPLIVTLYEENIFKYNSVIFIPVWKLNEFLNKFEEYFL